MPNHLPNPDVQAVYDELYGGDDLSRFDLSTALWLRADRWRGCELIVRKRAERDA